MKEQASLQSWITELFITMTLEKAQVCFSFMVQVQV